MAKSTSKPSSEQAAVDIKSRFTKLDANRNKHLERCRECSKLTIPALLPPEGSDENTDFNTPWQSLGARAVNNLASKLLLILLPANSGFHRLKIEEAVLQELKEKLGDEGLKTEVEMKLASIERAIADYIEALALRVPTFRAIRLLIVTGNACMVLPNEGGAKVYRLDEYVVVRDAIGNWVELVTKEGIAPQALPKEVFNVVSQDAEAAMENSKDLDLYTRFWREDDKIWVEQELCGQKVSEMMGVVKGNYPIDQSPVIVMRWSDYGGNYARGHVEEHLGDFLAIEQLSQSLIEGAAVAAKTIFMVNPNGTTEIRDIKNTPNCGFCAGVIEDVQALQVGKAHDLSTAAQTKRDIEIRLAEAFMLESSVRREAERVTAEEIRLMAQSLEDALGGIYSLLALEFQRPLVKRVMARMEKEGKIPELPPSVTPIVTTGFEALGRGHDLNKLMTFVEILAKFGPDVFKRVDMDDLISRVATSLGIDTSGLIISEEVLAQQENASMLASAGQQALPGVIQEGAKAAFNQQNNQQTPTA